MHIWALQVARKHVSRVFNKIVLKGAFLLATDLLIEFLNFPCGNFTYYIFQRVKYKGANQTARMRRLVCAFVVRMHQSEVFSRRGQITTHCAPSAYKELNSLK